MSLIGLAKAPFHADIQKLSDMVNGKRIAVVGNASSLFGKGLGPEIDAHDVIIRLNRGFIVDPDSQGSRTDIAGTSRPLSTEQIRDQYQPKLVYWLFWRWWRLPTWTDSIWKSVEIVPVSVWKEANDALEARPTSGFVLVKTLLDHTAPSQINVYGFDFYNSPNFYRLEKKKKNVHAPAEEAEIFTHVFSKRPNFALL